MKLKIRSRRFGEPRKRGEGLRVGTVRYLPRGVKKSDLARLDYFDVWFPTLAPTKELIKDYKALLRESVSAGKEPGAREFAWFRKGYLRELKSSPDARHAIALLSAMAKVTPITIGCYCENEKLCHRLILLEEIKKAGA